MKEVLFILNGVLLIIIIVIINSHRDLIFKNFKKRAEEIFRKFINIIDNYLFFFIPIILIVSLFFDLFLTKIFLNIIQLKEENFSDILSSLITASTILITALFYFHKEKQKKEQELEQMIIGFEPITIQDFFSKDAKKIMNKTRNEKILKLQKGNRIIDLHKIDYVKEVDMYVYDILRKENTQHPLILTLINKGDVAILPESVDIIFKKIKSSKVEDMKVNTAEVFKPQYGHSIKEDISGYGMLSPHPHKEFYFIAATKANFCEKNNKTKIKEEIKKIKDLKEFNSEKEAGSTFVEYEVFYDYIKEKAEKNEDNVSEFLIVLKFKPMRSDFKKVYTKAYECIFKYEKEQNIGYISAINQMINREKLRKKYGRVDEVYDNLLLR